MSFVILFKLYANFQLVAFIIKAKWAKISGVPRGGGTFSATRIDECPQSRMSKMMKRDPNKIRMLKGITIVLLLHDNPQSCLPSPMPRLETS